MSISQLKQYPEVLSLISAGFTPMLWSFPSPGNYEMTLATVFQYYGSHQKDAGTSSMVVQKRWCVARSTQYSEVERGVWIAWRKQNSPEKSITGVVKPWNGSPGEVLKSLSLDIFNTGLDKALDNLIQLRLDVILELKVVSTLTGHCTIKRPEIHINL